MCPSTQQFLLHQPPERILSYLTDEVDDEADGVSAMRHLQANRLDTFHSVLCALYDVICYRTGDTCFASSVPAEELDRYFISTAAEDFVEQSETPAMMQSYATLAEAEAAAVQALGLDALFFGSSVPA